MSADVEHPAAQHRAGSAGGMASDDGDAVHKASRLAAHLKSRGIDGVALGYVDNSGITRVKTVPITRLPTAAGSGVGMSPCFDVFGSDDSMTESPWSTGPVGDLRLHPDLDRVVPLASQPGWAWAPVDRREQDGSEHPMCHRSFARRMASRTEEAGFQTLMGFEIEWFLSKAEGAFEAATTGPAYSMTRVLEQADYLRALLQALAEEAVEVEQLHPEYSPGQFEISTTPSDPLRAADDNIHIRQSIRGLSLHHGLWATFSPSIAGGTVGSGAHLHFSLWQGQQNIFSGGTGPRGMTREGEAFVAGVLEALPALLAVGAPSTISYLRLVPHNWAGAFQCWGAENREAAIRFVSPGNGTPNLATNVEVKCFDATASPYLVTGAVLACGLDGLAREATLPPEVSVDPANLTDDERNAIGADRLPTTLSEALEHFETNKVLEEAFGLPLFETFAAVRRAEIARFDGLSPEDVVAATLWKH